MKPFLRTTLVCLALLGLLSSGLAYAGAPQLQGTTPAGHPAQYAVGPVGPDFQVSGLLPLPIYTPPSAAVEATIEQNRRYQNPDEVPENIQVSYSGDVPGASHPVNDFSECMVYLDPTDPSHLLGSSKFFYTPANYLFYTGVYTKVSRYSCASPFFSCRTRYTPSGS